MKARDIEMHVVRPALRSLGIYDDRMYSEAAVVLMMGTIAQESDMGAYTSQIGGGPALGIPQIERDTHTDNMINFVWSRAELLGCLQAVSLLPLKNMAQDEPEFFYSEEFHLQLVWNWQYAVAHARIKYWRAPEPLPALEDLNGMAEYWKKHYNSAGGKGSAAEWLDSYDYFVRGIR